jgi:hypothetical protein
METLFYILNPDVLLLQEWLDLQDLKNLALTCKLLKNITKTLMNFKAHFPRKEDLKKIRKTSFLLLTCKFLTNIEFRIYGKYSDNEAFTLLSQLSEFKHLKRFLLTLDCSPCNISHYFEKGCWSNLKYFEIIADSCRRRYGQDLNLLLGKCLSRISNLEKLRIDCLLNENLFILKDVVAKNCSNLINIHLDFFTFTKSIFRYIIEVLQHCKNLEELHIICGTVVFLSENKSEFEFTDPIIKLLNMENKINILEIDVYMMTFDMKKVIKNSTAKKNMIKLKDMKINNWRKKY